MNIITIKEIELIKEANGIKVSKLIRVAKDLAKGRVIYHHSLDQIPNFNAIVAKANIVPICKAIVLYLRTLG